MDILRGLATDSRAQLGDQSRHRQSGRRRSRGEIGTVGLEPVDGADDFRTGPGGNNA